MQGFNVIPVNPFGIRSRYIKTPGRWGNTIAKLHRLSRLNHEVFKLLGAILPARNGIDVGGLFRLRIKKQRRLYIGFDLGSGNKRDFHGLAIQIHIAKDVVPACRVEGDPGRLGLGQAQSQWKKTSQNQATIEYSSHGAITPVTYKIYKW